MIFFFYFVIFPMLLIIAALLPRFPWTYVVEDYTGTNLCNIKTIRTVLLYNACPFHPSCLGLSLRLALSLCPGCAGAYISLLCGIQACDRFSFAPLSSIVPHLSLPACLPHLFSSYFLFVFSLLCFLALKFRYIILSSLLNHSLHLL